MKKYKVLNGNMTSPFKKFKFEIGKKYTCDDFDDNPKKDCSRGFYATDIEGLPYSFNVRRKAFEAEVSGKHVIFNQYKQRFEHFELIRECSYDEVRRLALAEEERLGYRLSLALFPFNPFSVVGELEDKHIEILKKLDSVWDSVSVKDSGWASWVSVSDSVWASVKDSVWASVSVKDSVWASVSVSDSVWVSDSVFWDSVWAYISGIFPNIKKWKYIDHEEGINPFQPAIDLWNDGFVPSFDGQIWRLHNKNGIVKEINK